MNVVLATNDPFAFSSSTWSSWAGSPYDLQLVAKDGSLGAHRGLLLPLFKPLRLLVQAAGCCGTAQVMLPDTSLAVMAAVKDLLYEGCCQLDTIFLPEILETLSLLGANVSSSSFVEEMKTYSMEDSPLKVSPPSGRVNRPLDAMKLENVQGKPSGNSGDALMTGSSSLVEGMVFPNHEEMVAYVRRWSRTNLSPVSMSLTTSAKRSVVFFRCPHKLKKKSQNTGKRKPKRNLLEYADCPFLVRMKGNKSDGSFAITMADTEHRGHEVSAVQFKKYSQKRGVASAQRNVSMPRPDESEEVSEGEREGADVKGQFKLSAGGEADGVSGFAE